MNRLFAKIKKSLAIVCVTAIVLQLFNACVFTSAADSSVSTNGNGGKTDIGMWYVTYNNASMWSNNFGAGNPIRYRSLLPDGSYGIPDSSNPEVIDFHLQKLYEARVDFVVFDLTNGGLSENLQYGVGNEWIVENAKLAAQRISIWNDTHEWKIRYAVAIGAYWAMRNGDSNGNTDYTIGQVIEWQAEGVNNIFFSNSVYGGDDYYQLDGKPLLIGYDWACNILTSNTSKRRGWNYYTGDKTYGNQFTIRAAKAGEAGTYGWYTAEGTKTDTEVELVNPGWGDSAGSSKISRENGAHYSSDWNTVLSNDSPRIVIISSFNDYHEKTAVFSADTSLCDGNIEEKWNDPNQYWNATVANIRQLRNTNGDFTNNVLIGSSLSASVSNEWWEANYPLANLIDGISSADTVANKSAGITYDSNGFAYFESTLASPAKINCVKLYYSQNAVADRAKDVAVDVKLANGTWKRVAEQHNIDIGSSHFLGYYFEPVTVQKVRITANNKRYTGHSWLALEIAAYYQPYILAQDYFGVYPDSNANYNIPYIKSDNLFSATSGATVTGHSTSVDENTKPISNLIDGRNAASLTLNDDAQVLFEGIKGTAYYEITPSQACTLNSVIVYYCWGLVGTSERADNIAIDVKLEDGTWKRVAESQNIGRSEYSYSFAFAAEKIVKVRITGNHAIKNDGSWAVLEIEGYYDRNITAYTGVNRTTESYNIEYIPSDNYLTNASVSSSNTNEYFTTHYPLSRINDGNTSPDPTVGFAAGIAYANSTGYFEFELETAKRINQVAVYYNWEEMNIRPKDLAVDVLLANGTWKRVAELHNIDTQTSHSVEMRFEAVETKMIRVSANGERNSNTNWRVVEITAIYNQNMTPADYTGATPDSNALYNIPYVASANFAKGKTVFSSNNDTWLAQNYPLVNLTDGYTSPDGGQTGRSGIIGFAATGCAFIDVDFEGSQPINHVKLYFNYAEANKRPQDIAIDVLRADNHSWVRVAERHNILASEDEVNFGFADINATHIRVIANKNRNSNCENLMLMEIAAYYNQNVAITGIEENDNQLCAIATTTFGDVNYDCVTNAEDLLQVRRYLLGLSNEVKVGVGYAQESITDIRDLVRLKKILTSIT